MNIKLRLNHIFFWWYYRLVDEHFRQFTILKSISLLRQHYEHEAAYNRSLQNVIRTGINEAEEWKKKYLDLKMQVTAGPDMTRQLNKMFGTDYTNSNEN